MDLLREKGDTFGHYMVAEVVQLLYPEGDFLMVHHQSFVLNVFQDLFKFLCHGAGYQDVIQADKDKCEAMEDIVQVWSNSHRQKWVMMAILEMSSLATRMQLYTQMRSIFDNMVAPASVALKSCMCGSR